MKDFSVYLPNAKFVVGTVLVLAVLTLVWRNFSGNTTVAKVMSYLGYAA